MMDLITAIPPAFAGAFRSLGQMAAGNWCLTKSAGASGRDDGSTRLEFDMKPLHNPKAGKTRDRKLGVVVVLIIAAGSALGALAISQDDASNSVSGHKMQTASRTDSRSETPPLVRPLSELDPSEQLTRAYVALFDTSRTEDVKSGD